MKIAIVHYWWLSNRGGEAVVAAMVDLFPTADLYIHVCDVQLVRQSLPENFSGEIHTSFISRLPWAKRKYQMYLPIMPLALEQWDLSQYDLVISSESGPAKGVITRPDALHICYCHSPMRYLWDMYHEYLVGAGRLIRLFFPLLAHWLRVWDKASADRVDIFVANSNFIAARIKKYYRRNSEVIFPPVNTTKFLGKASRGNFYLYLGQLVAYKRPDLAVQAFNELGLPLVVIGEGELFKDLSLIAKPNVTLLGRQPFSVVKQHLESCKGLIFPGVEDFGIVPVEAMAAGAPVVAYSRGGVLDTIEDKKTGILFHEQTTEALIRAVQELEEGATLDSKRLSARAAQFDKEIFQQKFKSLVKRELSQNKTYIKRDS